MHQSGPGTKTFFLLDGELSISHAPINTKRQDANDRTHWFPQLPTKVQATLFPTDMLENHQKSPTPGKSAWLPGFSPTCGSL